MMDRRMELISLASDLSTSYTRGSFRFMFLSKEGRCSDCHLKPHKEQLQGEKLIRHVSKQAVVKRDKFRNFIDCLKFHSLGGKIRCWLLHTLSLLWRQGIIKSSINVLHGATKERAQ